MVTAKKTTTTTTTSKEISVNTFLSLISQVCDSVISDVLAEAEAQDYASHFARHRITWEMLKTMTDKELKEVRGTNGTKYNLVPNLVLMASLLPGRRESLGTRLRRYCIGERPCE